MFENRASVAVLDAVDQGRLHPPAAIGEHRIRRDHPHDRGFAGAERIGKIVRQIIIDAEAFGIFTDQGHADILRQPHRHGVDRPFEGLTQRNGATVTAHRKILRTPDAGALPLIDLDRPVDHDRRRGVAIVHRRRIDQRLEGRSRLSIGLGRAIELALVEREATHHRENAAGPRIHRDHGAGHFG